MAEDIIARKDLGNGLELRVEPSFTFQFIKNPKTKSMEEKMVKEKGLDISLYKDGKLCLSSKDHYKFKKFEHQVIRGLKLTNHPHPYEIFFPFVAGLCNQVPKELLRVYEFPYFDSDSIDISVREGVKISRFHEDGITYEWAFIFDWNKFDERLLKEFRENPKFSRMYSGDSINNSTFTLYFV